MKKIIYNLIVCILFVFLLNGCTYTDSERYIDDSGREWKYCLELQEVKVGKTVVFTIYSDNEDLTFEQVWLKIFSSDTKLTESIPDFYLKSISSL